VEIVHQLEQLFLSAVPTVIIVFLFYLFMSWSFFKPMMRVLNERHDRAEGAKVEAEAARVAAREKLQAYNDTVKKMRSQIFVEQEAERRRTLDARQATITAARATAQNTIQEAKVALAAEVKAVEAELQQSSGALADDIANAILAGAPSEPGNLHGSGVR
jgi:F0F1-type ATP synthase membrane subunit b/b'